MDYGLGFVTEKGINWVGVAGVFTIRVGQGSHNCFRGNKRHEKIKFKFQGLCGCVVF